MPITGSQLAPKVARMGVMRLGASRLDHYQPIVRFQFNARTVARLGVMRLGASRMNYGTTVTPRFRIEGFQIQDLLNGTPNTIAFRVSGYTPQAGNEIVIGLGATDAEHLVFAGHIVDVAQIAELDNPDNVAFDLQATSYEYRLNGHRVTKTYTNQSATAIITDLVTTYTTGFSTSRIAENLPTLAEISFFDEDISEAVDEVMRQAGGDWFVDYAKRVTAFLTLNETAHAITDSDQHGANQIVKQTDLTQVRTRIIVRGGGSGATAPLTVGATTLPLQDASRFSSGGGTAFHKTQNFTYTGKVAGLNGSNVSGLDGPATGPTAAIASGVGGVVGNVSYKVGFRGPTGETIPGAASNVVTGAAVTPPASSGSVAAVSGIGRIAGNVEYRTTFRTSRGETTPSSSTPFNAVAVAAPGSFSVAVASGLGRIAGSYQYAATNVTPYGETLIGATSSTVNPAAVAAPSAPTIAAASGIGRLVGDYKYKLTYVTQYGETLASSASTLRSATAIAAPGAPTTAEVSSTIGVLIGAYIYKVTFVTPYGETLPGTAATTLTIAAQSAPSAPSGSTTGSGPLIGSYTWKVSFVSALGETMGSASGTGSPTVQTASSPSVSGDGTGLEIAYAVTYVHPVYGESALSSRTIDTNKGTSPVVTVNSLPSGCGWNVYSTGTVGSGQGATAALYKVAEMAVGASSFTHVAQTGPAEGVIATLGRSMSISSIAQGPTGTVARRIYRTRNGGSTYYLVGQIDNNSSGQTFVDNVPDEALTTVAPVVNPNGKQVTVSSIPTGPTGTLARRVYRTKAGGSEYFLLGQIDNNSGTSFTDNTPDDSLTEHALLVATAGGEAHTVTITAGAAGTIARRIYRTEAGGSIYKFLAEIANNSGTSFTDDIADAALGATTEPLQNTAGGQNVNLTSVPTGPTGTLSRNIYRTKNGGSVFFLVGEIRDNSGGSFTDDKKDDELTVPAPIASTAGGQNASLTGVPTGPTGTIARRIYRTKAGGTQFFLVGQIPDNVSGSFTDDKEDSELSVPAPTENDAGASVVALTSIPTGPTGITARRIYRTKAGGTEYFFVKQINDNTTLTYTDDAEDADLNDLAPTESTIGALVGDVALKLVSTSGFTTGGWARADSQLLRYTGISGSTLTGIPTSGMGALVAAIKAGSAVIVEPHLTGVSGVTADIPEGEQIRIRVEAEDVAAQTALATTLGVGDGVKEEAFDDSSLSVAEATTLAQAHLALVKDPLVSMHYTTPDQTTKTGRTVTYALGAPTNIAGTFTIQSVTLSQFDPLGNTFPLRTVEAGSRRFSLEALLRLLKAA